MSEECAEKIRIGVSQCLLGDNVRHDGGHKKDPYLTMILGNFFQWIPVCPELEAGFGVPRESVRLMKTNQGIRMRGIRSGDDHTDQMINFSVNKVANLKAQSLHGYIFKKDSPSCGVERVKVYSSKGAPQRNGRGLFAEVFIRDFPLIPVEEEGRLQDLHLRENFIERVFCYHRWNHFTESKPETRDLVDFHRKHKMTLLSHSPRLYRELGRIVATSGKKLKQPVLDRYASSFMLALQAKATAKKHANVLYHLMGYLKKLLDPPDRNELVTCIEQYRMEQIPLIVPITLLRHHFNRHPVPWVLEQTYLNPYPAELMLRNHV